MLFNIQLLSASWLSEATGVDINFKTGEVKVETPRPGRVLEKAADAVIHPANELAEEFEESLCSLVGREPGKNCNISGGIKYSSDGNIVAIDSQGQEVEKREKGKEVDILQWSQDIKIEAWELENKEDERYIIGGLLTFSIKAPEGITWFKDLPLLPTVSGKIRDSIAGYPLVGARRVNDDGSYRLHRGTDYATQIGEQIKAPFNGKVIRNQKMSKKRLNFIEIKNSQGIIARVLYVNSQLKIGDNILKGDTIGTAEDIHKGGYKKIVPQHIHVEYRTPNGHSLSPDGKYAILKNTDGIENLCKGENRQCFSPDKY